MRQNKLNNTPQLPNKRTSRYEKPSPLPRKPRRKSSTPKSQEPPSLPPPRKPRRKSSVPKSREPPQLPPRGTSLAPPLPPRGLRRIQNYISGEHRTRKRPSRFPALNYGKIRNRSRSRNSNNNNNPYATINNNISSSTGSKSLKLQPTYASVSRNNSKKKKNKY